MKIGKKIAIIKCEDYAILANLILTCSNQMSRYLERVQSLISLQSSFPPQDSYGRQDLGGHSDGLQGIPSLSERSEY